MTYSSLGAKRQPQFADADAPDVAVNPSQVANYAADYGNYKVDTAAARSTAAAWAWEGLLWRDSDGNKVLWKFTSGSWKAWESDWISYVPVLTSGTSFVIGSGGSARTEAKYKWWAGLVVVDFALTFGTAGASFPTAPEISLPVTARAVKHPFVTYAGDMSMFDVSAGLNYPGKVTASDAATGRARLYSTNTGAFATIAPTAPFAWAAGDTFAGQFTYEPA